MSPLFITLCKQLHTSKLHMVALFSWHLFLLLFNIFYHYYMDYLSQPSQLQQEEKVQLEMVYKHENMCLNYSHSLCPITRLTSQGL